MILLFRFAFQIHKAKTIVCNMSFNIITNIEQNDVNSYEASVNSKLLSKLKEKFTDFEFDHLR